MQYLKSLFAGTLSIVFFLLISSCEKNNTSNNPNETDTTSGTVDLKKCTEKIVTSDNAFGIDLFTRIVEAENSENENKNIFISPTSVSLALAMTYNGAADSTKAAMQKALKKEGLSTNEINQTYEALIDMLVSADPDVILDIANAIYYEESFTVEQDFVNTNQTYYDAEVNSLDFSDPASLDVINGWVANNTNNKITKILNQLNPDDIMVLLNAIYFKGTWKYEFEDSLTTDRTFYMKNGDTKDVPMMEMNDSFNYYSNDLLQMVELPYGNGDFSMVILLPNANDGIDNVIATLSPQHWNAWLDSLSKRKVDLRLPKFTFKYDIGLNDVLKDMGMGIAFEAGLADFSNINSVAGKNLYISNVLHKTFVEVNEQGTEAAAVTAVTITFTSVNPYGPVTFHADHPFLFAIKEKSTNAIVFIGRMMEPVIEK